MTASLPVPHEDDPEVSEDQASAPIVALPTGSPARKKPAPRRPAKPRAPRRTAQPAKVMAPPPLPDLPADAAARAFADRTAPTPEPEHASAPEAQESVAASAPEPQEPVTASAPELQEPVVEPTPIAEPEVVENLAVEPDIIETEPVSLDDAVVAAPVIDPTDVAAAPEADDSLGVPETHQAAESDLLIADAPVFSIPPAAASDVLVMRGVSKTYGATRAVDGIDLTVPVGSFYGLVGPNGAGKTTTLSLIAGLLAPDRGSVLVGGSASSSRAAKRLIGVLPDRLRTFDRLTGRQLLHYYGVLRGLRSAVVESRSADLARAFDLTEALGRPVSDYSAGMLKKVMLAGAMIHSPRLLVLDEPFESVDPVSSQVILDILSTYVAHGGTVILSSHGMELVERVCTRVAVLVAGQILAEGTVADVRGELTLEQRLVELTGGLTDVEGLEWLHTFSD